MRDALIRLLEPPIEALGFELVDVEIAREGRGGVLRIYHRSARAGCRGRRHGGRLCTVSHAVGEVLEIA